jgi:hypothetical protein
VNLEKADTLVERGANALEAWARGLAVDGGVKRQLAEELVQDAAFLRKLKPSLIAARARGEAPTAQQPEPAATPAESPTRVAEPEPSPPTSLPKPKPKPKAKPKRKRGGALNPFAVAGVAFVGGIVLAKIIDWRGHAHPRR